AEDGIRDRTVTGVQTCALPICVCPSGHQDLSIGKQGCLVPNPCASHIANARESTRGGVEKLCRGKSSCSVRPSCYQDPSVGKPRSEERRVGKVWQDGVGRVLSE